MLQRCKKKRSKMYDIVSWVCFYLWRTLAWSFVIVKVYSIVTVLQVVFGYPLAVSISSLCCYTCYFGVTTNGYLNPLICIAPARWPSPLFHSTCLKVQPCLVCSIIWIPVWRGSDLGIFNETLLHAKRCGAFLTQEKMKRWNTYIFS